MDRVEPPLAPGVSIEVRRSVADQLLVQNRTNIALEVLDTRGSVFLRIGPTGVEANLSSQDWYLTSNPDGFAQLPDEATRVPPAEPRFVRVSDDPSWGWFDHRLHAQRTPPNLRVRRGGVTRLEDWTVPVRYGGVDHLVRGHREHVVTRGTFFATVRADSLPSGVHVSVAQGKVPALLMTVDPGLNETVVVLGDDGLPFGRITSSGAEVDSASPTWSLSPASRLPTPPPSGQPRPVWTGVGAGRTLTWLEPRARYARDLPPKKVLDADRRATVGHWSVPVIVGDQQSTIEGDVSWVPNYGSEPSGRSVRTVGLVAFGAVMLVFGAAMVVLIALRNRRRAHDPASKQHTEG